MDGKDKEKLEEFCIKCSMYLDTYDPNMHDKTKINFVIGYLEGNAQKWLNPYLVEEGTHPVNTTKLKQTKDVQGFLNEFQ
ncbi:hypothetical protein RSAG8_09903, partial [Rhizoctonia solani AG-8 WAC10335]